MEESHAGEGHRHSVFITAGNNNIVTNGATGLCNVGNAALLCTLDIVIEGEESVGAEGNTRNGVKIGSLFCDSEGFGLNSEIFLPVSVFANVFFVLVDISVDDIVTVGTAESVFERKIQDLVVLT